MAIKVQLKDKSGNDLCPVTSLAYVSANTSGGIAINGNTIFTSNIPTASISNFTTDAKNAASTYVHSASVIPQSAVNGLATEFTNASNYVSTYTHSANTIPISAVSGLTTSLSSKMGTNYEDYITLGNWMTYESDKDIGLARFHPTTTVTGATASLNAGEFYIIDATAGEKTISGNCPVGSFGLDSYLELFVTNAGYVHMGQNTTLVGALEPDAVNNCVVHFQNGRTIITVTDNVEAYLVNNTSTAATSSGTLAYGLKQTGVTYNFIGFRSELNASSVPTGGQSATTFKHVVGNGYAVGPTVTGALIVKSGATIRDVKLSGVTVTSGTATLTDVHIPSGGTVVTGAAGGIYVSRAIVDGTLSHSATISVEKCEVNGLLSGHIVASNSPVISGSGTIAFGAYAVTSGAVLSLPQTHSLISGLTVSGGRCTASGDTFGGNIAVLGSGVVDLINCTIVGGTATFGGGLGTGATTGTVTNTWNIASCVISGNRATYRGGGIGTYYTATYNLSSCTIVNNVATNAYAGFCTSHGTRKATISIKDCHIGPGQDGLANYVQFSGSNHIEAKIDAGDTITVADETILDLTGNTNAIVLSAATANGITFGPGIATIITHDDKRCKLGNISRTSLPNNNRSTKLSQPYGAYVEGIDFIGLANTYGGAVQINNSTLEMVSCQFLNNSSTNNNGGAIFIQAATVTLEDCIFSGNSTVNDWNYGAISIASTTNGSGKLILENCIFQGSAQGGNHGNSFIYSPHAATEIVLVGSNYHPLTAGGKMTISSGAVLDFTGCALTTVISATGNITVATGGCQIITSAGVAVPLAAGTYKTIKNDGTTTA